MGVAPFNVTEYLDIFQLFLDPRRLAAMQQNRDGLDNMITRYSERYDTALGASKKRWIVLDRNPVLFSDPDRLHLDMPYVRCPVDREYFARLSTLVFSPKNFTGVSDHYSVYMFLDQPYYALPFPKNLGRWGRDSDF